MLTVGLLAVVVYLYTVVAFNFFRKFYNKSEDGDTPDMKCDDMLTVSSRCVLSCGRKCVPPQPQPEYRVRSRSGAHRSANILLIGVHERPYTLSSL